MTETAFNMHNNIPFNVNQVHLRKIFIHESQQMKKKQQQQPPIPSSEYFSQISARDFIQIQCNRINYFDAVVFFYFLRFFSNNFFCTRKFLVNWIKAIRKSLLVCVLHSAGLIVRIWLYILYTAIVLGSPIVCPSTLCIAQASLY